MDHKGEITGDEDIEYDYTGSCKICGSPNDMGELCKSCAEGNDPFFECDNCGKDFKPN